MDPDRSAARRKAVLHGGLALIAFVGLVALASCSSTQITGSEIGNLVPQILGIALLVWIVILIA